VTWRAVRTYLSLAVLFAIEALVFYWQLAEQITPYYPRGFDQLTYFIETFRILNRYFTEGWLAFARYIMEGGLATGATFSLQGALAALIGGPNRTAMVSLNLLYFLALQGMLFRTVLVRTERLSIAWTAVAMLMSLSSLFSVNGGIYDYRIDFSTMCLYGIWICAVLRTEAFLNMRWSIIAGLIGGLMISMRYFTISYLGMVTLTLFAIFVGLALRGRPMAARQAKNAFICGVVTLVMAAPFLFAARHLLYDYYGVGHFLGAEKDIRAAEAGVAGVLKHLLYYPENILWFQLGRIFLFMAAVLFVTAFIKGPRRPTAGFRFKFDLAALGFAIFFPLAFLSLDVSKSPVVGGIVTIPITLLCVIGATAMQSRWVLQRVIAVTALTIGAAAFVSHATAEKHLLPLQDRLTVNRLSAVAAHYILQAGLVSPHLAFDRVNEFLNTSLISLTILEQADLRRPIAIYPVQDLGNIFAVSREQALGAIEKSDIIVLTDQYDSRAELWPFNDSMREYWPDIASYAKANLVVLASGKILGVPYQIYARLPSK
jgi:hypothetical protein